MKQFYFALLANLIASIVIGHSTALAGENFWQAPQRSISSNSIGSTPQAEKGALYASLATTEQVDIDGHLNLQQQVSITQAFSQNSSFSMKYSSAREQRNWVLGFQNQDLTVSMMRGKGEDYATLSGEYEGVDPYLFHGGNGQDFEISGYAVDYGFGQLGHLQYGQAVVLASGLENRRARYLEWSNNRYFARTSRFDRGGESVGSGLDLGFAFSNKRVALQTMNLENRKRMQRIRFEFDGQRSRQYWLDFSAHQNPLFEANNDYRVMFNFRTLLGTNNLANYQNESVASDDEQAIEDEGAGPSKKKKGRGWKRALLIGGGVAAAAALSSSGSAAADDQSRFRSQNEAAKDVLNEVNPMSITLNREFGGWVFMNTDGSFGTTVAVQGDASSVTLPDPRLSVPIGSNITASYHTHAAFDPRFDNENFSPQDLQNDRDNFIDGYLATPFGQFKLHDVQTDTVVTLGTVATE